MADITREQPQAWSQGMPADRARSPDGASGLATPKLTDPKNPGFMQLTTKAIGSAIFLIS
jgi:hypothetical protein